MPSGWDVYYVVFLSALLALGIPASLAIVSFFVKPGKAVKRPELPGASLSIDEAAPSAAGRKINTRFFLSANAALVLIALALLMIPYAGILRPGMERGGLLRALISILSIAVFSGLGLVYAARKGDLDWLESFKRAGGPK